VSHKPLIVRVFFFALVLSVFAVPRVTSWLHAGELAGEYSFRFEESARALGIDFVHEVTPPDPKIDNLRPWFQGVVTASAAVCDVNADGWPDIYVTNSAFGSRNRLYINRGGTAFDEVAGRAGIADVNQPGTGVSTGAACADYDNDGHEDLLVHKYGHPELFRNRGDGTFARVTRAAGLGASWVNANDAIWWDYNRDGCLDIYIPAYYRPEHNLWQVDATRILQDDFNRSRNAGRNEFYVHARTGDRCSGTFTEAAQRYGLDDPGWSFAAGAADLDADGFPDLYVANDFGPDVLFLNVAGTRFQKVVQRYGIGHDTKKGMSVAFGDFNNTGRLGIYVSNITEPGYLVEGNMLWENLGDGRFRDVAWKTGVADGGWAWGSLFGDFNNDGHADIYCTNGFVTAKPNAEYWYDMFTMAVNSAWFIEDAATYPPMEDKSWSGHQPSRVFLNNGRARFRDVALAVGATDRYDGRGVATADLDRNGTLDVIVGNTKGPLLVYLNRVAPGREWIQFRLKGTRSNRSALGAHVTLRWNDQRQVQVVDGGGGFSGYSEKLAHFGLGENPTLDRAEIRWPSGQVQVLRDLEPRQSYVVEEP
jgi:hypothetical protein